MAQNNSPLSPELIDEIFADALDIPEPERASFIGDRCRGNPAAQMAVLELLRAHSSSDGFLQVVADAPRQPLIGQCAAGERIGGFEIREVLGAGGMGEVYLAYDHASEELVALKFIGAKPGGGIQSGCRLKREARTRGLAHPNICPIYGLHEVDRAGQTLSFLCMKYLPGRTLAEALRKDGPWKPQAALSILKGIAAGLDAAHEKNIVHRDLKPRNVMLMAEENGKETPVILDFGLVQETFAGKKRGPNGSSGTLDGAIVGTPAYMAPEQFLSSTVTPAADIYAFGMMAAEIVCGHRPFPDETILPSAVRRQRGPDEEVAALLASVPGDWRPPILQALDPDPRKRPKTAAALVKALEEGGQPALVLPKITRRQAISTFIAILGVSLLTWILRFKGRWMRPRYPPLVMITPVTTSSAANLAETARVATLLLGTQLKQSSWVTLLDTGRMAAAWKRMRNTTEPEEMPAELSVQQARQIALRNSCQEVLYANLAQTEDELVLRLKVESLGSSANANTSSQVNEFVFRNSRDLPDAAGDAARWVRQALGESRVSISSHDFRPEELTTSSWEALKAYTAADTAWRKKQDSQAAILNLKNALAIDPEFPAAAIRLADILMANTQPDEAYAQYDKAVRILTGRNLTDRESLRARAIFQLDVGFCQEAADTSARYASEYPGDALPLFYQASALDRLGKVEAAEQLYTRAIAMMPDSQYLVLGRARLYLWANRLEEARRDCERAQQITESGWRDQTLIAISMARGDLNGAGELILRLRKHGDAEFRSKSYALEACWLAEQGRMDEAKQALRAGLAGDLQGALPGSAWLTKQRLLAEIHIKLEETKDAVCACAELLARTSGLENTLQAAGILARLGEPEIAELAACDAVSAAAKLAAKCGMVDFGIKAIAGTRNGPCKTVAPAWPIYNYWQQRLRIELALERKQFDTAAELSGQVPADAAFDTAPDYLLRVAKLGNVGIKSGAVKATLRKTPGRWWFEPERNPPGFLAALRA